MNTLPSEYGFYKNEEWEGDQIGIVYSFNQQALYVDNGSYKVSPIISKILLNGDRFEYTEVDRSDLVYGDTAYCTDTKGSFTDGMVKILDSTRHVYIDADYRAVVSEETYNYWYKITQIW